VPALRFSVTNLTSVRPSTGRRRFPEWTFAAALAVAVAVVATSSYLVARVPNATRSAVVPPLLPNQTERRGTFAFLNVNALGEAVRWDPCEPIHWVFNPRYAPKGALVDVRAAMRRLSRANGMRFVYEGVTSERAPVRERTPANC
jgi:hypothetical protein